METTGPESECVYILRQGTDNLFKIGRTGAGVEARIRQLATGNPTELSLYDSVEVPVGHAPSVEAFLLNQCRSARVLDGGGRDFFRVTPEDLQPHIENTRRFAQSIPIRNEVNRLAKAKSDGRMLKSTADDLTKRDQVLKLREQIESLIAEREMIYNEWKVTIGTADGIEGIFTWRSHESSRLDLEAFRTDHEDLYQQYVKTSTQRSIRVL